MDFNFADLTVDSQAAIFERFRAFDEAVKWVAKFAVMDEQTVRQVLLGAGRLETSTLCEDEISLYWDEIDKSRKPIP